MAAKSTDKTSEKAAAAAVESKAAAARERELESAISSITKAYGEGAIMRLGEAHAQKKIEVIPNWADGARIVVDAGTAFRRARGWDDRFEGV